MLTIAYNFGISAILRISLRFGGIYEFRISFHFGSISEVFRIYIPLDENFFSPKRFPIILLRLFPPQTNYLTAFLSLLPTPSPTLPAPSSTSPHSLHSTHPAEAGRALPTNPSSPPPSSPVSDSSLKTSPQTEKTTGY